MMQINLKQIQSEFENIFTRVAPFIQSQSILLKFKTCLSNCYSNYVSSFFFDRRSDRYFSKETHTLIHTIKDKVEKYGLIIVKADKGNTVVILYRSDYVIKMLYILSDTSKFRQVNEEHTLDRLRKFQSFLRYHHKKRCV